MNGNVQLVRGRAWFDPTIIQSMGEMPNHSTYGTSPGKRREVDGSGREGMAYILYINN